MARLRDTLALDPDRQDPAADQESVPQWLEAGSLMEDETHAEEARFQAGIVVDTHLHTMDYLPGLASSAYRWIIRRTVPPPFFLDQLPSAGVDVAVANAVGDRVATAWWGRSPWHAIEEQLARIRAEANRAGAVVATSAAQIRQSFESGRTAVVLGLEGADGIGTELGRLDQLFNLGVRIAIPVHLRDNQIGTTCLPWDSYIGLPAISRRRKSGLTDFGRAVIERMNSLGMIIDVSHADATTLHDVAKCSDQPIVATHSGARKIEDFKRYLDDAEIALIAGSDGIVGLWPYHYGGHGPRDLDALMRHARYIADLVGPKHLCVGTDINGVPGMLAGFRAERDVRLVAESLRSSGFSEQETADIMGGNFMRVFEHVAPG